MKIGIIVYSKTNNTNLIATQLNNQLKEKGYDSIVLQVVGVDDDPRFLKKVRLKTAPDVSSFDVLIVASPVYALHLSPIMQAYLDQLPDLSNKIIMGFVTQAFPYAFLGGNQAIICLKALIHLKSNSLLASGIVHWFPHKKRIQSIRNTLSTLVKAIETINNQ